MDKTSKYRGVHYDKKARQWMALFQYNKKVFRLGSYTEEIDAFNAYCKKYKEIYGYAYTHNEITINRSAGYAMIPLGLKHIDPHRANFYALIDIEDVPVVQNITWHLFGTRKFYARSGRNTGGILMHRLIMKFPRQCIDHINNNGLDNRKVNLRIASASQNAMNRKKISSTSSIYKGVGFHIKHNKWQAHIKVNGKIQYLGLFTNETDAALAYNNAAKRIQGEFAKLNEIQYE